MTSVNITANINSILILNGSNFNSSQKNLLIALAVMDLDLALKVDSPSPIIDDVTSNDKNDLVRWKKSNRMCVMIIKKTIPEAFRGSMPKKATIATKFLVEIE